MSSMVEGEVILRPVVPEDAAGLCRIANMPGFRLGTSRMPFETVTSWRRRLDSIKANEHWIIAERAGEIAGYGILTVNDRPRLAHSGQLAIGVADHLVGQGIGHRLMAALIDLADNWCGLKRLELHCKADNEPAVRLYTRHGFVIEGRHIKAALRDGVYVDTLTMARLNFPPGPTP